MYTVRMNENVYKSIGKNIKRYRLKKNLTQQMLADKIGKGINFVGKIEIGFSKPSLNTIIDISKALNIPLKNLFEFD